MALSDCEENLNDQAEIERLRGALEEIMRTYENHEMSNDAVLTTVCGIAYRALHPGDVTIADLDEDGRLRK